MKKILLILLLFYSSTLYAQSLHVDSTRFITGLRPATLIHYALPTTDKGILLVGADLNNPGGIIPYFPLDTSAAGNVMIVKIDSNQQISWIKVYGGSQEEGANSTCQLPDGGYAVLCTTSSNNGDITGFHGGNDYWLLRLDDSGNMLWENCYGSPGGEQAASIALTPDGGFIMLGTTNDTGGEITLHYGGDLDYDWWVVKTDSLGNIQWQKTLGGTGQETDAGTVISVDSAYYIVSSSNSIDHNCTDSFWHEDVNTGFDYYVLKLDANGNVLWDSSYGGGSDELEAYALFDTRDSTIVITGTTASDNTYMVTDYNGGYSDMWMIKISRNGTLLWEKCLGGPNMDEGAATCTGPNGGYINCGNTYPGPIGIQNCWMFALDSMGNETSNDIFGGSGDDNPYSIIPYSSGYAAAGYSGSNIFTEGTCNINYSGAFVSYISYWPLSISNIQQPANSILVYPNPAQDQVTILLKDNIASGTLTITNSIGQTYDNIHTNSNTQHINVLTDNWASGIYIIKWQGEDGTVLTKMFIKN